MCSRMESCCSKAAPTQTKTGEYRDQDHTKTLYIKQKNNLQLLQSAFLSRKVSLDCFLEHIAALPTILNSLQVFIERGTWGVSASAGQPDTTDLFM